MQVEIWSDVMCPWCAVGKARFEAALATFEHREALSVRWRSFELDPQAPREQPGDLASRLASKYGMSKPQALAMMDRVTQTAAECGLDFHFEKARSGNTFDAHRLLHLAAERGVQDAAKSRLLNAYLSEGEAVGLPEVLRRLAVDVGLDADEVAAVLAGDAYAAEVRADERRARELGIRGVPFFLFAGQFGVSGAQPEDVFKQALALAWEKSQPAAASGGEVCDDSGCAIP